MPALDHAADVARAPSYVWGIALREWSGTTATTRRLVAAGLALLVASTVIVGYGNYLAVQAPALSTSSRPE
jgi:L-rhamnose-H+ transport protein